MMEAEQIDLRIDIVEWKPGNMTLAVRYLSKEMGHSYTTEWASRTSGTKKPNQEGNAWARGIPTEQQQQQGESDKEISPSAVTCRRPKSLAEKNSNTKRGSGAMLKLKRKIWTLQPTNREQGKWNSWLDPTGWALGNQLERPTAKRSWAREEIHSKNGARNEGWETGKPKSPAGVWVTAGFLHMDWPGPVSRDWARR
jgi:hypothetical protein